MFKSYLKESIPGRADHPQERPAALNDCNVCANAGYGKGEKPPTSRPVANCGKKSVQVMPAGATFAAGIAGCAGRECFVHDAPNGSGASSALRTAAKAAINLARGAGCLDVIKSRANVVIT
jgi:hypothetical protein